MDFLEIGDGDDFDDGNSAHDVSINDRGYEFLIDHYSDLVYFVKCLSLQSLIISLRV